MEVVVNSTKELIDYINSHDGEFIITVAPQKIKYILNK